MAQLNSIITILGTAHRLREPGKQSPDGRLRECEYSRAVVAKTRDILESVGCQVFIDYMQLDLPRYMQSVNVKLERSRELAMRVDLVNELCQKRGAQNCIYVSMHVNASGSTQEWRQPNGWQVSVSPQASARSKVLADCLFDAAKACGLHTRQPLPLQKFWKQPLYVLDNTSCPAVLTENLFQDNREDVEYLLSDEGRHTISHLHAEGIVNYIESL